MCVCVCVCVCVFQKLQCDNFVCFRLSDHEFSTEFVTVKDGYDCRAEDGAASVKQVSLNEKYMY